MNRPALGPFSIVGLDFAEFEVVSSADHRYFLVMFDVFSHHVLIYPSKGKSAEDAARALLDFSAHYMDPLCIWSDQGTHFTAALISKLANFKGLSQVQALPHMEASRGLLERMVGCVKDRTRAFMTSILASPTDWHLYVPVVASIHNNLPSAALRGFSPNDILFGFSRSPVQVVWEDSLTTIRFLPLGEAAVAHVKALQLDLSLIHHELELRRFSDKTHVPRDSSEFQAQFSVDDFVLVANRVKSHSLAPRWSSIGRITKVCSPWTYEVRDILRGSTTEFHVSMLRPANNLCFNMELSDWERVFYAVLTQHNISHISEFDVRENELKCLIHFHKLVGTRSKRDSEWASVKTWYSKIPLYFDAMVTLGIIKDQQHLNMLDVIRSNFRSKQISSART